MHIKELTIEEFNTFSLSNPLSSFYQTLNYALVLSENGFEYEFIGYMDHETIVAASLILFKKIEGIYYGYSPRGFLIDYTNHNLLKNFTNDLKDYLYKKEFAFLKINPNIQISRIDKKGDILFNENQTIVENLKDLNYLKLKNNLYFESMLPRFNPIIDLENYKTSDLDKNTRNKVKKAIRKGLSFEKVDYTSLNYIDEFTHAKTFFNNDFYNTFNKDNQSDLFLIYIDTLKYLENSQKFYVKQSTINQDLNDKMVKKSHSKNINKKMNSDISLLAYKKDIMEATKLVEDSKKIVVGAALVVNYNGFSEIIASGYDKNYKRFAPNYYLHYSIIKYYKKISKKLNINGISGDFTNESMFKGLNRFKLGWNPTITENIGEFDLIINQKAYKYLLKNKYIQKEFSKKIY